ncbi:phosphotransferase, partial [Rubrivirga sp.]|uniref:phosphotransferase n=1 Tax=Rubrivirga sp. TaxID=1885344 RepID=UPI003C789EA3
IYDQGVQLADSELTELLTYATALHELEVEPDYALNTGLRELNHAHIFDLPFRMDNGFPLDALYPGLAKVARPFRADERLARRARELGKLYLANDSRRLIHGDFYPGSFLRASGQVYVIDGEFSHRGRPEFDLGVLLGHLLLAGAPERHLHLLDTAYQRPPGFDGGLVRQFAYVEVIRRIIGIAQLPLAISLDERQAFLESARAGLL